MATSGSSNFNLDMSEITEEAFERCGLEFRTGYDAKTARRSLNLLFAEWANRGLNLWTVEQITQSLVQYSSTSSVATYPLGTITATVGASTYLVVGKTITGSTSGSTAVVLSKPTATTITITVWPSPENSTDQLIYYRVRRIQDADAGVNTADIPFRFLPCLTAGLAYYLSIKKSPQRITLLKQIYDEEFMRAASEDSERVALRLVPSYSSIGVL